MAWQARGLIEMIVGVVAVALLAIWATMASRRARALDRLERGLVDLGEGRSARPIRARVVGRIGRLARRFDEVVPRLQEQVDRLEQDRRQLRAVLGGMAEGVIAVDARRRLLFANESAGRLFAFGTEAVGRLVPELIRSPKVQGAVEATLGVAGGYRGEITLTGRDALTRSSARVLDVVGTPLPGSPPMAILVFHDVTELRRLERMRQDFVANASHELKTPLSSIKAYTETLLDWALEDERVNVRYLKQIEEQADRLDRLIFDLLSLARLESGQEVFRHGPLPLATVVLANVEAHRDRADAKALTIELDLDDGPTWVLADEEAIRQVLDNLIDNAIKYTPEGGRVRVSCRAEADSVALEVADSGIGIPRDDLPRIFERFYRVDRARSREMGGTGLGLSIVKHLVQSIGGEIAVVSRPGDGSRFTVRLPMTPPPST